MIVIHGIFQKLVTNVGNGRLFGDSFELAEFVDELRSGEATEKMNEFKNPNMSLVKGPDIVLRGRLSRAVPPTLIG